MPYIVRRGGHTETEELTLDYLTKRHLFSPQQPRKMLWDAFIGVLIIYSVLVIPMEVRPYLGLSSPLVSPLVSPLDSPLLSPWYAGHPHAGAPSVAPI